jgi:hypothetical protein
VLPEKAQKATSYHLTLPEKAQKAISYHLYEKILGPKTCQTER